MQKVCEQEAKNSRGRQSSLKKTHLKDKFDALLNWQFIFYDSNCVDEPFDDPSIECFACKKIVLSHLT